MRKLLIFITCLILILVPFTINSFATNDICTVTLGKVNGNIGDTVFVPVSISNNPGISGVTLTINYNPDALEFIEYSKGSAFTDNIILKAHPDKKYIKLALVELSKDSYNNGDILTLQFKIKNTATAEFHEISVVHNKGNFSNKKAEYIDHKVISGGVDVAYNPDAKNCPHKTYDDWQIAAKPTCTSKGAEQRICKVCGHKDTREVEKTEHIYEDVWTIDTPATPTQIGVMTRHCKHCTSTIDRLTFPYKDTQKEDIDNSVGNVVSNDEYTENLYNEQYTNSTSSKPTSSKVSSSTKENTSLNVATGSQSSNASEAVSSLNNSNIQEDTEITQSEDFKPSDDNKAILIFCMISLIVILIAVIVIVACKKTV